jgi:hypothetical protein
MGSATASHTFFFRFAGAASGCAACGCAAGSADVFSSVSTVAPHWSQDKLPGFKSAPHFGQFMVFYLPVFNVMGGNAFIPFRKSDIRPVLHVDSD